MKRLLTALLLALCAAASAQEYTPEMRVLAGIVSELRDLDSDQAVYDKLVANTDWTLMNEIGNSAGECNRYADMGRFGLNDLAMKAESSIRGRYTSAGNFCNGTDPNYNYSMIEKTVAAGATVCYDIPGRSGRQVFVVVPFNENHPLGLKARVDGSVVEGVPDGNGNFTLSLVAAEDKPLSIEVRNPGAEGEAFVILNYNARN